MVNHNESLSLPFWAPYIHLMRLNRPIGIWLLLFPCWWSISLASPQLPSLKLVLLFALGAIVMRSAGCIVNDLIDRRIDAQVVRTKSRPLANGAIPIKHALALLLFLLFLGLLIVIHLSPLAIKLGILSLALVFTYPWMKRLTYWPQAFLGITFNWGTLMGWATIQNTLTFPAFSLLSAGFFWTLFYDTIYAHQDKEDDFYAQVKSTALLLNKSTRPFLYGCIIMMGISLGAANQQAPFLIAAAVSCIYLALQTANLDLDCPADCLAKFCSSRFVGWIILAGILASKKLSD